MDWLNPAEDYLTYAILSGRERKRCYQVHTGEDGFHYIQEISILYRSRERRCINTYLVVSCFEHKGRNYLFMEDTARTEPLYFQEYICCKGNEIKLFDVEEPFKSQLIEEYWPG
ncbi:MAG: hypothetical protein HFE76_14610 [Firmicutes bacterium]|nr:hypothetical protein [Bacillota bacterium]